MMIFGSWKRGKNKIAELLEQARALNATGDHLPAIRCYEQALELGAEEHATRLQLAILHANLGQPERAAQHLKSILAADPAHADAEYMLGAVSYDLGRYAEAAALCERALQRQPKLPQAHYTLGLSRLALRDFEGAAACFARCMELRRAVDMGVSTTKVAHDVEQLEYLLGLGKLSAEFSPVAAQYRELLAALSPTEEATPIQSFDAARFPLVARTYKQPLQIDQSPAPAGPMLNPAADWRGAQQRYLSSNPSVTVVDDLLSSAALDSLRRYCRESTLWNDLRSGYLGTYLDEGFAPPALLRIATELRERLPEVIRDHPLQSLWAYKYDSTMPGIGIGLHADAAAVNVNFWITPDEANFDADHGGLLVHLHKAPPDWSFERYNRDWQAIVDFLEARASVPLCVPYRCNRAVIFDSDLFHATDAPRFREGYTNRRINVTLLYGQRRTAIGS
jgi:hypothetical protein